VKLLSISAAIACGSSGEAELLQRGMNPTFFRARHEKWTMPPAVETPMMATHLFYGKRFWRFFSATEARENCEALPSSRSRRGDAFEFGDEACG